MHLRMIECFPVPNPKLGRATRTPRSASQRKDSSAPGYLNGIERFRKCCSHAKQLGGSLALPKLRFAKEKRPRKSRRAFAENRFTSRSPAVWSGGISCGSPCLNESHRSWRLYRIQRWRRGALSLLHPVCRPSLFPRNFAPRSSTGTLRACSACASAHCSAFASPLILYSAYLKIYNRAGYRNEERIFVKPSLLVVLLRPAQPQRLDRPVTRF
jgi:hypothetical protein